MSFKDQPSVEHILPQSWQSKLATRRRDKRNGFSGVGERGRRTMPAPPPPEGEKRPLNPRQPHYSQHRAQHGAVELGVEGKAAELMKHSLLPINQALQSQETWDETAILARGEALYARALQIWRWG